jgi:hypothetical protein
VVFLVLCVFELVVGLILFALPVFLGTFLADVIVGTLVAPLIAVVVTLMYFRLSVATAGGPASALAATPDLRGATLAKLARKPW